MDELPVVAWGIMIGFWFLGLVAIVILVLLAVSGPLHWRGQPPRPKSTTRGYKDIGGKGWE